VVSEHSPVHPHVSPDFQRGLIYTVHPRILAPLVKGEEYRVLVSTTILTGPEIQQASPYEVLYRRARMIADRRADELRCGDASSPPHTWIVSHGWFRMDLPAGVLVGAVVLRGAVCGVTPPQGREEPENTNTNRAVLSVSGLYLRSLTSRLSACCARRPIERPLRSFVNFVCFVVKNSPFVSVPSFLL
jgi:hypothetical protein